MYPIKEILREVLIFLKLDLTRNLRYDRLSKEIISSYLRDGDNCIDIGAHEGQFLKLFLKCSPKGVHYAFEPIPSFFHKLTKRYSPVSKILPYALGNTNGESLFNYIKNAPSYSGLQRRKYKIKNPDIEVLSIQQRTLDSCIPENLHINLIKIDVEGGEYDVLRGAQRIIRESNPLILFECGMGASEYYGTKPEMVYNLLDTHSYQIFALKDWLNGKKVMNQTAFLSCFSTGEEYFFVAEKVRPIN